MLKFLALVIEMRGNAEVTEAASEVIEYKLLSNTRCVLNGIVRFPAQEMNKAVELFLLAPTFIESTALKVALDKTWGDKEYKRVKITYDNYAKNR